MLRIITTGSDVRLFVISFDTCRRKTLSARAAAFILSDVFSLSYDHPNVVANVVPAGFPRGRRLQVELGGDAICTPEQARVIMSLVRRWPSGHVIAHYPDGRTRPFDTSATAEFDAEGVLVTPLFPVSLPPRSRRAREIDEDTSFGNTAPVGL